MSTSEEILDRIYDALGPEEGPHVDEAKWAAGLAFLAGVLLHSDPFTKERRLRSVQDELRKAIVIIPKIMSPEGTT